MFQMWERELKAMERLDVLETNLVLEVGSIGEDSNVIDLSELEAKVQGTLRKNVKAWEEAGAGSFVLNVINEGFFAWTLR